MELNIGNYVRNENGLIGKIIGFKGDMVETDNKRLITYKSNHSECKIKERPIDLIEVGDYVNGDEVHRIITDRNGEKLLCYIVPTDYGEGEYTNKDIESIVTKEQFESMQYVIKED